MPFVSTFVEYSEVSARRARHVMARQRAIPMRLCLPSLHLVSLTGNFLERNLTIPSTISLMSQRPSYGQVRAARCASLASCAGVRERVGQTRRQPLWQPLERPFGMQMSGDIVGETVSCVVAIDAAGVRLPYDVEQERSVGVRTPLLLPERRVRDRRECALGGLGQGHRW